MVNSRIQVQYSGDVFRIHNPKLEDIIEPVLTESIPVLGRNRQCIFLAAQQAIQFEFYFELIACLKVPQLNLLQARISAEDVHSNPAPNQDADYRLF